MWAQSSAQNLKHGFSDWGLKYRVQIDAAGEHFQTTLCHNWHREPALACTCAQIVFNDAQGGSTVFRNQDVLRDCVHLETNLYIDIIRHISMHADLWYRNTWNPYLSLVCRIDRFKDVCCGAETVKLIFSTTSNNLDIPLCDSVILSDARTRRQLCQGLHAKSITFWCCTWPSVKHASCSQRCGMLFKSQRVWLFCVLTIELIATVCVSCTSERCLKYLLFWTACMIADSRSRTTHEYLSHFRNSALTLDPLQPFHLPWM